VSKLKRSVILSLINRVFRLSGINNLITEVMNYLWMDHSPRNENFDLLVRIKFWNLFFIYFWIKTEKFTCPNKVLLGLGQRTSAYRENWDHYIFVFLSYQSSRQQGLAVWSHIDHELQRWKFSPVRSTDFIFFE